MSWNPFHRKPKGATVPRKKDPLADVVTLAAAADLLGISPSTAAIQARKGRFPGAKKIGKTWFVPLAGVEFYKQNSLGRPGPPLRASK